MALALITTLVLTVIATLAWATTQPSAADSAERASSVEARVSGARPGCLDAIQGIRFYAAATHGWQAKRGGRLADRIRWPNCDRARAAAQEWHARATKARQRYTDYVKQIVVQRQREQQHPKLIALRLLGYDRDQWDCLTYIVSMENRTWDPTLDYGGGHGNVYEAYGIPQATPGTKMASAGADWRTNPETQLRWMIAYCKARFGSVCGAAYSRRVNGTY